MTRLVKIPHLLPDDYDRLAILAYIPRAISESGIVDDLLTDYSTCCGETEVKLNAVVERDTSNPLTAVVKDSHEARLRDLTGIHAGIAYYLTDSDPEKVEAAKALEAAYDKQFKNMPNKKRVTYTRAIKNFLDSLQEPEMAAYIEKLGMSSKATQLTGNQNEFINNIAKRVQMEENNTTPETKVVRAQMHDIYESLEHHLFYMEFRGHPLYSELTGKLNTRIGEILAASKNSHSHEDHEEEDHVEENPIPDEEQSLEDIHFGLHQDDREVGE